MRNINSKIGPFFRGVSAQGPGDERNKKIQIAGKIEALISRNMTIFE